MEWKVLVVDDDPGMRFFLRAALSRSGFSVIDASNGLMALEEVSKSKPDLILMDVGMPIMDGFTACQIIRKNRETSRIPVILQSCSAISEYKTKSIQSGANLYLDKMSSPKDLVACISNFLLEHYQVESCN